MGGESIDDQAQFADVNRDVATSQEITKDMERGGLDASVAVDHRLLTEAGRNEIANDFEATKEALINSADFIADELAVLGDDLPEELRAKLGDTGEDFYDALIRGDFTQEDIDLIMSRSGVVAGLEALEVVNANESEAAAALVDIKGETETVPNNVTIGSDGVIAIEIIPDNPNIVEQGLAGLGQIQQSIDELSETNPIAAEAVMFGLGAVTGGVVTQAAGYAVEKAIELTSNVSDTVSNAIESVASTIDDVLNGAGGVVTGEGTEDFVDGIVDEQEDPDYYENAELGKSNQDIKDGIVLAAEIVGLGLGTKSVTSGSGSDSGSNSSGAEVNNNLLQSTKVEDRFPSASQPNLNIAEGSQNKHIVGTNQYKTASQSGVRSTINDGIDPQKLVNQYAGTGQHVNPNKAPLGQPGSTERIKTDSPIGEYVDVQGINHGPTNNFTIRYSKKGVHIVPAAP
ncbi:polymorphic toxin type 50 domain-containing protein [Marinomonas colpomeniae]|uniref:Bacterial toxin 50 domain-containing protein n=1 Tax=Marinomonas colpomeniae TaxID=2774408 RepID=A0ABR8P1D7_9GAMM|nr:polymorphic toxin type 50 domain-containing protein [Marinomonas colpomeniae]MBD5772109.1 hypothetical protein [Marinomonas colpomeniae]